ncbi:MAG: hypothetical protein ACK53Y_00875, partial [bacterium]
MSWNETGIFQSLAITFTTISGSSIILASRNIESVVFGGDRLRFSGQKLQYQYYEVLAVNGSQAILTKSFEGREGPQQWTKRFYGGKGYPLTSRI